MLLYYSQTLSQFLTSILFYLQVIGFFTLFQGYQRVHISYLSIHADRSSYLADKSGYIKQFETTAINKNKKQRYAALFTPSYCLVFIFILDFYFNNAG